MSTLAHTRVVLKGKAAKENFSELAYDQDWVIDEIGPASDEEPYEEVWIPEEGAPTIHLIDDPLIGIVYVDIAGRRRERLAELIRSRLDTYSRQEVIDEARSASSPDDLARAVRLAGAIAPGGFDQGLFEIILRAFRSEDAQTRVAAITAAGYAEWQEFVPFIDHLAHSDPNKTVREVAGSIGEGFHHFLRDERQ